MGRVKCPICEKFFDYSKEQAVKYSKRRYAHIACYPEGEIVPLPETSVANKDRQAILDYCKEIFGKSANYPTISKQIKNYTEKENYSYTGILKTLYYFYNIKGNSPAKANGSIAIVPYAYKDAMNYYYTLYMAQSANQTKNLRELTQKEIIYEIKVPEPKPAKIKLFDLGEE